MRKHPGPQSFLGAIWWRSRRAQRRTYLASRQPLRVAVCVIRCGGSWLASCVWWPYALDSDDVGELCHGPYDVGRHSRALIRTPNPAVIGTKRHEAAGRLLAQAVWLAWK